jgi:hypothetical protein
MTETSSDSLDRNRILEKPGVPLGNMGMTGGEEGYPSPLVIAVHRTGIGEVGHGNHHGGRGMRIDGKDTATVEEPEGFRTRSEFSK